MSTDTDGLWYATLQQLIDLAAHEVKDALNGVSLNLEVIRSRSGRTKSARGRGGDASALAEFAEAATDQFEALTARTEAVLFLSRPQRPANDPVDVAMTLRHLAALLVPSAKSEGGTLSVEGVDTPAATSAPSAATRLALAAPLLSLIKEGGSIDRGGRRRGPGGWGARCRLESSSETVVRFSHEPAGTWTLDPTVAKALAEHSIQNKRSGSDLLLTFPGHS